MKGDPAGEPTHLDYNTLKPWFLSSAFDLATNSQPRPRLEGNPGAEVRFAQPRCDESSWRKLNLPHDWGIEGPFKQEYPGETGKLPWWGVAWYRKHFTLPESDAGREIYLEVDGAMAYATVWVNGQFVGGWPYGYASWPLDLTTFVKPGAENVIAIRLDNPPDSSRWYPGRRHLPQRLAGQNRARPRGALGHLRHHARSHRRRGPTRSRGDNREQFAGPGHAQVSAEIFKANAEGRPTGSAVASLEPATVEVASRRSHECQSERQPFQADALEPATAATLRCGHHVFASTGRSSTATKRLSASARFSSRRTMAFC